YGGGGLPRPRRGAGRAGWGRLEPPQGGYPWRTAAHREIGDEPLKAIEGHSTTASGLPRPGASRGPPSHNPASPTRCPRGAANSSPTKRIDRTLIVAVRSRRARPAGECRHDGCAAAALGPDFGAERLRRVRPVVGGVRRRPRRLGGVLPIA